MDEKNDIIETAEPIEPVAEPAEVAEQPAEQPAEIAETAESTETTEPAANAEPKDSAVSEAAAKVDSAIDGAVEKVLGPDDDGRKLSIAAIALGAAGIVLSWVPIIGFVAFICAVLGIILGIKGRKKSVAVEGKASSLATAGLILGIVGVAFGVIGLLCSACSIASLCFSAATGAFNY